MALLLWVFRRLVKAPPARRGKQRIPSKTPAGVHMPGPSFSPAFAAMGTFLILLGLVFGGITLVLGALALALTLLYWLAEGLRIYDHDNGPTGTTLPAVIDAGPPPGVHMPGPSWRPIPRCRSASSCCSWGWSSRDGCSRSASSPSSPPSSAG